MSLFESDLPSSPEPKVQRRSFRRGLTDRRIQRGQQTECTVLSVHLFC